MPAGYSGTPLARKLGYKPGMRARVLDAPPHYAALLAPLPEGVEFVGGRGAAAARDLDLVHVFVRARAALEGALPRLMEAIARDGAIWVSWPKKAAAAKDPAHATDVTEDAVRAAALPLGLVDVKVCAVDEVWSGLKLVIRKEKR